MTRKTAGQLSREALADTNTYDSRDVGHALADDIEIHLYESIRLHKDIIMEDEFCVVMVIAKDPLIHNAIRRKFYCWPYLPKPRPNQAVFLYNKRLDKITKRLWVLPSDMVMAELAGTNVIVHKQYETMQAWSVAFFKGSFWEFIRYQHDITMPSEKEYFLEHREELIKAGCNPCDPNFTEAFDFDKIAIKQFVDSEDAVI